MNLAWDRLAIPALALGVILWASQAEAQSTFSDPFAPAAGSVAQSADDAAKSEPSAEDKKPRPKPKRVKPAKSSESTFTVVIYNKRTVGLVELTAALAGSSDAKKIAGPLAINRKTVAHLKRDKACLFDLKGSYADGADIDMPGVELCKDKVINLTDE